jgi:hypothetical protein
MKPLKRKSRRLPIPQHEFGFTVEVFRLFSESGLDGEHLAHERNEAEEAHRVAESGQCRLLPDA